MPKQHRRRAATLLAIGILWVAAAATGQTDPSARPVPWARSPYRNFASPVPIAPFALLSDERGDPALAQALSAEFARLSVELFRNEGWRSPFSDSDPLRVLVARKEADGALRIGSEGVSDGRLRAPVFEIDATALADADVVREAGRLFALAVVAGYGIPDTGFITRAAASLLSSPAERAVVPAEAERIAAAAPEVELTRAAETAGVRVLEEFVRETGGRSSLRLVFERASERGEDLESAFARTYLELTGEGVDALLLRAGARLYTEVEPEAAPSRIGLFDLQTGGFDAAPPAPFTLRHRTYVAADPVAALRVDWPGDAAPAAAVVRYRDAALPPDVVWLSPGSVHTFPLAGVARVDWLVAGSATPRASARPFFETLSAYPFGGLTAHASAGPEGPRVRWSTASHGELAGWAIFREEVLADGRIARSGPEILPASETADEPFGYAYLDPAAAPGTFYRYTVWAVTAEGLLARAFSATVRTAD